MLFALAYQHTPVCVRRRLTQQDYFHFHYFNVLARSHSKLSCFSALSDFRSFAATSRVLIDRVKNRSEQNKSAVVIEVEVTHALFFRATFCCFFIDTKSAVHLEEYYCYLESKVSSKYLIKSNRQTSSEYLFFVSVKRASQTINRDRCDNQKN